MNLDEILDKVIDFASVYGIKVIGAIVIWIIGSWTIRKIMKGIRAVMTKRTMTKAFRNFYLTSLAGF